MVTAAARNGNHSGVLVITDRKLKSYKVFHSRFDPVIRHWKIPYRFADVQDKHLNEAIRKAALILFLQPGCARRLAASSVKAVSAALADGTGLFVAEPSLLHHAHARPLNLPRYLGEKKVQSLTVRNAGHFVASTKFQGETLSFPDSITIGKIRIPRGKRDIILSAGREPVLFFKAYGRGKLGLMMVSPDVILNRIGFGSDLDVFYWKAIIFLSKKPLTQLLPPRFLTYRIEDSIGEGQYAYLDYLVERGHKIHLGLDLNDFHVPMAKKLKPYIKKNIIEFSPHAFTHFKHASLPDTELIYVDFSGKEYPKSKLKRNFWRLKQFMKRTGIRFSPVLTYHYCQLGKAALPFLKKMGVRYLTFPFRTNVALHHAMRKGWRRHPFGKLGFVCDRLPEDRDLYAMVSHHFPNDGLHTREMDVSVTSRLDFLYGLRLKAPGKRFEQYKEATERIYVYARRAFENLFFATVFTHETLINYLRLPEFKKVVRSIDRRLKPMRCEKARFQEIAEYYRRRAESSIEQSRMPDGKCSVVIAAEPESKVHLAVYRNGNGKIRTQYQEVEMGKNHAKEFSIQ